MKEIPQKKSNLEKRLYKVGKILKNKKVTIFSSLRAVKKILQL